MKSPDTTSSTVSLGCTARWSRIAYVSSAHGPFASHVREIVALLAPRVPFGTLDPVRMDRTRVRRALVIPGPCTDISGAAFWNAIEYTDSMVSRVCFETKRSSRLRCPPRSLRMRASTIAVHSGLRKTPDGPRETRRKERKSESSCAPEHSSFRLCGSCGFSALLSCNDGPFGKKKVEVFFNKENKKPKKKKEKNKKAKNRTRLFLWFPRRSLKARWEKKTSKRKRKREQC